jgi:N-methylhydantoinase B/oxoprolinase/acetone carboxylase alpha subunit
LPRPFPPRDDERLAAHLPGGMGDPGKRDLALVARDVRGGLVSVGSAKRDYRVALAPHGAVDEAATERYGVGPEARGGVLMAGSWR